MTSKTTTVKDEHGRDVPARIGPDVDLDVEDIRDQRGRRVDKQYVEEAVEAVHAVVRGRPSLSGRPGDHSPRVSFRIPARLRDRAAEVAQTEGKSLSELAREAFEQYLKAS